MAKNYVSNLPPATFSTKGFKSAPVGVGVQIAKTQVLNNTGGYVSSLDKMEYLNRFLILGSESNTYYQTSKQLTVENAKNVYSLLETKGTEVVDKVVEISESGRAPKNDPALFVLALASSYKVDLKRPTKNEENYEENIKKYNYALNLRKYALDKLPRVARTGTHLFTFVSYMS
jgi:60 kDa SS-A/Ro ribonucleoprotein